MRIYVVVVIALCWITLAKYRKLTLPKSDTELDELEHALADVKKRIPLHTSIGFNTNSPFTRRGVLYFKSALIMAPVVLENGNSDTVLLVEEPQFPTAFDDNKQECILRGGNAQLSFILMHTKK